MKYITPETIEKIESYLQVLSRPIEGNLFHSDALYIDFLPQFIEEFKEAKEFSSSSVFSIFKSLSVKPTRSYQKIKDELRFKDRQGEVEIKSKASLEEKALTEILNLINTSIYILKQKKEQKEEFKKFLIVMATNMYANLYSNRGKYEFAYYFGKMIEYHDHITREVTPYKSHSWRGEYKDYVTEITDYIDTFPIAEKNNRMNEVHINNIAIIIGQMEDEKLKDKTMQYFIKIGTFHISTQDFTPLASTNFKK
jgi:hypothetical protein